MYAWFGREETRADARYVGRMYFCTLCQEPGHSQLIIRRDYIEIVSAYFVVIWPRLLQVNHQIKDKHKQHRCAECGTRYISSEC